MLVSVRASFRPLPPAGLLPFLPVYVAYELGYSPFFGGCCMSVIQLAGLLAGPSGGHLSEKMGRRRVVMSSMALSGVRVIGIVFFFSSRRRHTRWTGDWSSDVCSSD